MFDFLLTILTSDIFKTLVIPIFSLLTIIFNNNYNLKNVKIQMENDIKKHDHELKRDIEQKRLNNVYKPIIRIYERAQSEKYMIDTFYDVDNVIGNGIDDDSRKAIEKIVESNLPLMKLDDIVKYEQALHQMNEDEVTTYRNARSSMEGMNRSYYIFDERKEFINSIKNEAIRIENDFQ